MKFVFKTILFLAFVFIILVPPIVIWKAVDHQPYIKAEGPISQQDIIRAR